MQFVGEASAKMILSGEHSVVYGYPALAMVADLKTEVIVTDKPTEYEQNSLMAEVWKIFYRHYADIPHQAYLQQITSTIPIGCGLGSSAALACASFRALAKFHKIHLSDSELINLVQESEKVAHGDPSGVDATTISLDATVVFRKDMQTGQYTHEVITNSVLKETPFLLIQSGSPTETTKDMVTLVRETNQSASDTVDSVLQRMGELTQTVIDEVKRGVFVPQRLTENERLLEELGVVGEQAKQMIHSIEAAGGFAKITGAGGCTSGSGILLVYHSQPEVITNLAIEKQWKVYR